MGRPGWADTPGGMMRFQRAAAEVWRDRGDVALRTLAGASLAQDKEDMYAYRRFFYGRGGGTFMEMGALDGLRFSNTFAFEKLLGWRGVHIEASPSSFQALARNRPNQLNVHAAVCDRARVVHYVDYGRAPVRGIAEFMAPTFLQRFHPELYHKEAAVAALPAVQCHPLTHIMDHLGVQHINFYVLDVEGAELLILQSVDFGKLSFDVICVENDGRNVDKDRGVVELLAAHGYDKVDHIVRDDWFVRKGFNASSYAEVGSGQRLRE